MFFNWSWDVGKENALKSYRCVIQGLNQVKLTQETGKGLFAMDGVQNFLVLSFRKHGRETHLGAGKFRKNEFPCSFFLRRLEWR